MKGETRPLHPNSTSLLSTSTLDSSLRGRRVRVSPLSTVSSNTNLPAQLLKEEPSDHFLSKRTLRRMRARIARVTVATAGISCLASAFGYFVVRESEDDAWKLELKVMLCILSFLQILLIVAYWKVRQRFLEGLRTAKRRPATPISFLQRSQYAMVICIAECVLHTCVPLPGVNVHLHRVLFGRPVDLSLDDVLFLLLLARNYHSIRAAYWVSSFSSLRSNFFSHIGSTDLTYVFFLKYWFYRHSARFVLATYVGMVLMSSLIQYTLEHEDTDVLYWDDSWLISATETTIGYGDVTPRTTIGQFSVLLSCLFGVFALGLINSIAEKKLSLCGDEFDLFCRLTHAEAKAEYLREAVVLIQLWWKLLRNRRRGTPDGRVVLSLYCHLTAYRAILLRCHGLTSVQLRHQVRKFQSAVHSKMEQMREHLLPVIPTVRLVRST